VCHGSLAMDKHFWKISMIELETQTWFLFFGRRDGSPPVDIDFLRLIFQLED
jgi:hypothetical protein